MTAFPCILTVKHQFPIGFSPLSCVSLVKRDTLRNNLKRFAASFTIGMLLRTFCNVCFFLKTRSDVLLSLLFLFFNFLVIRLSVTDHVFLFTLAVKNSYPKLNTHFKFVHYVPMFLSNILWFANKNLCTWKVPITVSSPF